MSRQLTHRALALTSIAIASTLACGIAAAQESQQLERVEVTGSNIKRLAAETASPVQIYNRDEIRRTGGNTVRQVLDTLTATSSTELRDDGNNSSFASGATETGSVLVFIATRQRIACVSVSHLKNRVSSPSSRGQTTKSQ